MSNNEKVKKGSSLSISGCKLALKFLTRDKIASFYLILSTIIAYTSLFILFNVCYLEGRADEGGTLGIIIFISAFISSYLFWYINNMSLENRRKEMAVETICGVSKGHISMLAIFQLITMSVISIVISFILANILAPIFIRIIYSFNGEVAPNLNFSIESILVPIIIILIQFTFVLFNNAGVVYRCEPIDLFKKERNMKSLSISVSAVKMGISLIFIEYIGLLGVFYCGMVLMIDSALMGKKYNRNNFMILKFLKKILDGSLFLVVGYIAVKFASTSFAVMDTSDSYIIALGIIGVSMMMIIVTIAFIYKVVFSTIENKDEYKILTMIGYTPKEVKKIARSVTFIFSLFIILVPLFDLPIVILFGGGLDGYRLMYIIAHIIVSIIATGIILKITDKLISEYIK